VFLKNRCPSSRLQFLAPIQFRTGEKIDFTRLRVFGCPAQIFIKEKDRSNNKISARSEKGTFIGMSKLGNGFLFRVKRTKQFVEVDSADVKFNETFSDCRDRKGKIIKGGRVLDPELFNVPDMEATISELLHKMKEPEKEKPSRFTKLNFYANLDPEDDDNSISSDEKEDNDPDSELEKPFNDTLKSHEKSGPIKKQQMKKRDVESIKPSQGFQTGSKNKIQYYYR
jgi:hypothetical protein